MAERDKNKLVDKYSVKDLGEGIFDPRVVEKFHRYSDVDRDKNAQHHTIGPSPNQAASGAHTHDGTESRQLLEGVSLTGAKTGNPAPALASVIAALVKLGAVDNTTA